MECTLCSQEMSKLSQIRVSNGFICKNCLKRIPKSIKDNLTKYSIENLTTIVNYMDALDRKDFTITASFGSLHIDEIHGLFVIEDDIKKVKDVNEFTDMFYCLDLREVGLTPTNPTQSGSNVLCDFELHCWFDYPECSFTIPIKKKAKCNVKRLNSKEIQYEYPGDYFIFMNMFNQMLETARKKHRERNKEHFVSKTHLDLFKAHTLFMLSDAYDIQEVESQRNKLLKAFQGETEYISIINQAYNILLNALNS